MQRLEDEFEKKKSEYVPLACETCFASKKKSVASHLLLQHLVFKPKTYWVKKQQVCFILETWHSIVQEIHIIIGLIILLLPIKLMVMCILVIIYKHKTTLLHQKKDNANKLLVPLKKGCRLWVMVGATFKKASN